MIVSQEAVRRYLGRDFDNHLWLKRCRQEMLLRELRQLKVPPVFKTEPWLHQLVCFYLGLYYPQFLFLLDMGLGKSKVVLDLLTQALRERRARRGLVFVPRIINMESWQNAVLEHSDLEPWLVNCKDTEEKWERLLKPRGDLTIIDYAGLHLACSMKVKGKKGLHMDEAKVAKLRHVYDFVAPDESHKVGNHETLWFQIVSELTRNASHCYATTGTLFNMRRVQAVWSQFFLVDRGLTFGQNMGLFNSAFFRYEQNGFGAKPVFDRTKSRVLHTMLGHRSIQYRDTEVGDLPSLHERRLLISMGTEQEEHYLKALEGLINTDSSQIDIRGAQWLRMRQITSGYLQWRDQYGDHEIIFPENPKLDELERLVDEAAGAKVVIGCEYTRTGQMICDRLKAAGVKLEWLYGGSKDPTACKRRFIEDPATQVLVMQSESGGTGIDGLQHVARYMVMYESPSNPTPRRQVVKRLHRPGQGRHVHVFDLVCRRTVDAGILDSLQEDIDLYEKIMSGKFDRSRLFTG